MAEHTERPEERYGKNVQEAAELSRAVRAAMKGEVVPLASLERVEAERDRLKEALHEMAAYTEQHGAWSEHWLGGAVAGHVHHLARSALASLDREGS